MITKNRNNDATNSMEMKHLVFSYLVQSEQIASFFSPSLNLSLSKKN